MRTSGPPDAGLLGADGWVMAADGRRLRTMAAGTGDDLVVCEAGLGASGLTWDPVRRVLSSGARVVAYERAGMGDSDPDTAPRTLARLADDLEAVIAAHPHHRLVLVGHSWGGPVVRVVAARRRATGAPIDGLVLVDPSDERASYYSSPPARMLFGAQTVAYPALGRLGLLAPFAGALVAGLGEPLRGAVLAASTSPGAARATAAESRHLIADLVALRDRPPVIDGIPLRLVTATRAGGVERPVRRALLAAHRATVAALPGAVLVPARRSTHMVPLLQPDLIAEQVRALLD